MTAPDEFHPDAHPDAKEITGDRRYGEWGQCIGTSKSAGRRCKGYAQGPHGKCNIHGGADGSGAPEGNDNAEGGGAPAGNRNASTHDLYTASNTFYQEVATDTLRQLCDNIYYSYVADYREIHGAEPSDRTEARLTQISINQIKILHGDNWSTGRPDSLDTGNALVDRETRIKTTEHESREEHRYSETAVAKAQRHLRKEDRKWLKDMGLLGADVDISVDGQVDHDHDHGLDDATEEIIEDLADDLQA